MRPLSMEWGSVTAPGRPRGVAGVGSDEPGLVGLLANHAAHHPASSYFWLLLRGAGWGLGVGCGAGSPDFGGCC